MMRHPPDSVPSAIAVGGQDDPERDRQVTVLEPEIAPGDQRSRDDPHRLLRVVAAVPQAVGRGRQQLQPPEPVIDAPGRRPAERPQDQHHQQKPERHPDERREHDEQQGLGPARQDDRAPPGLGHRRARVPDERCDELVEAVTR
jgi:hypothetical protein